MSVKTADIHAGLAQGQSTSMVRKGSQVQILHPAPFKILVKLFKRISCNCLFNMKNPNIFKANIREIYRGVEQLG